MSTKNLHNGRKYARRNRHPRPTPNSTRPERSRDEQVLSSLPYRKGHLTNDEMALFGELRGELSPIEHGQLTAVAETLRQPIKRLRALDLIRYWGQPLTEDQQRMLPWFAGLAWQRPLPKAPLRPVPLARHLLCSQDVPEFLFQPFAHPEQHFSGSVHWELCRLLAIVGTGGGLAELREQDKFWTWVPPNVFEQFLRTPPDVPVLGGLIDAFVRSWDGPHWLAEQAFTWTQFLSFRFSVPQVLRVVHGLCLEPLPPEQARAAAETRLAALSAISTNFGLSTKLPIPDVMPPELEGWHSYELRTPDDFEVEDTRIDRMLRYSFQDAQRGQISLWSLRREEQTITVQVDVPRMRAYLITDYRRDPDPEEERVLALWAQANGLTV